MMELSYDLGTLQIKPSSVKTTFEPYKSNSATVTWILPNIREVTETFDPRNPKWDLAAIPDGRYKVHW